MPATEKLNYDQGWLHRQSVQLRYSHICSLHAAAHKYSNAVSTNSKDTYTLLTEELDLSALPCGPRGQQQQQQHTLRLATISLNSTLFVRSLFASVANIVPICPYVN